MMKKRYLIPLGFVLLTVCAAVLILAGRNYTLRLDQTRLMKSFLKAPDRITVAIQGDDPVLELKEQRVEEDALLLTFRSLRPGKAYISVNVMEEPQAYFHLYVHPLGVITCESYFGDCTGDVVIPIALILFLAAYLWATIRRYRENVRISLYQYRNVMALGLTVFLTFLLLVQFPLLVRYQGILHSVNLFLETMHSFSVLVLPAAFVLSILITISNISLMRREGRNWRNMLGTFLGVGLCVLTLLPTALGEYLQWSPNAVVDVHNEKSAWLYIETFTESAVSMLVTYLECILLGTVILGVKSARHIPAFDKDYMLILGCQINNDGTLTPLLRSRADKAVEFARAQKEKTGKELVFVPSGGKGPDEIIPEADAIKNYLLSLGIPEERILPENESTNTYENIRNSMELIRKHAGEDAPKVAFSTTNYHVFRAGMIAQEQGETLEGAGSPTKRYFWINAFIREFVATLTEERKKHLLVLLILVLLILTMTLIKYFSVVI